MYRVIYDVDGVGHVFGDTVHNALKARGEGHLWKSGPTPKPYWDFFKDWKKEDGTNWTYADFKELCDWAADQGILFDGPLREGYKESIEAVAKMGHQIIIHTDRPFGSSPEVCQKITIEWFAKHGIEYDELWFGPDKTTSNGDFIIEDRLENYDMCVEAGMKAFLLNRPWNEVEGGDARNRINEISEFTEAIEEATKKGYTDLSFA
jgi:uncharacterized HAD superfamily protein